MAVLAVAGCGGDGTDGDAGAGSTSPPVTDSQETAVPDPSHTGGSSPTSGDEPGDYLDAVIADAAQRAGVPPAEVQVERNQAVQWRDGSLGCPEPGMAYTQAIVDGYWVELLAGGERYDYRLDHRGNFRLCEQALRTPPYQDR